MTSVSTTILSPSAFVRLDRGAGPRAPDAASSGSEAAVAGLVAFVDAGLSARAARAQAIDAGRALGGQALSIANRSARAVSALLDA